MRSDLRRARPSLAALLALTTVFSLPLAAQQHEEASAKCPITGMTGSGHGAPAVVEAPAPAPTNQDWWPNQLDLRPLHHSAAKGNPLGADFDYAAAFATLDIAALKRDIETVLITPQDWWPADYGHYGPLMIRLAWHSAGTYRLTDGRGGSSSGTIRFAPLNSWPDNVNLDKARRLLWPVKQKYGQAISWADLMILTGNVALESMGFETFGFGGGRVDVWEPELSTDWGPENEWLADQRHSGERELDNPLAATQMGLIYVNPEGPNGKPDPLAAAHDIRTTFGRMAMNDEETVALIAGGHTFGKAHGATSPEGNVGAEPERAALEEQGLGWANKYKTGKGEHTITSGLEGAWTTTPAKWSHDYFDHLFGYDWELTKSPAGAWQWTPKNNAGADSVPDAHVDGKFHAPMMFTTDLALRMDPVYGPISKRFHENPDQFAKAFAKAWYKLTHRDMGPYERLLGPLVPAPQIWQDPVPVVDHALIEASEIAELKKRVLASGLAIDDLVRTAWASAVTYRDTDHRGGTNGARVRLAPQNTWAANDPEQLAKVLGVLKGIQGDFNNSRKDAKRVSMADMIVIGGAAGVEAAAHKAGHHVTVPVTPGRTDATAAMTDAASFDVLEPKVDGFRNHFGADSRYPPEHHLVERARLLTLTAPEMTVLVGGMRAMGANTGDSDLGVFTSTPGTLDNQFFTNLLDMELSWKRSSTNPSVFEGRDASGNVKWQGTAVDLVFGSNSQLRALSEVYASPDRSEQFVHDFVAAWTKVMNLGR